MPRFTSEEARQRWIAAVRASKAARLAKKNNGTSATSSPGVSRNLNGIAGALEEIDSKIAALQLVRKNLVHAQELVNL